MVNSSLYRVIPLSLALQMMFLEAGVALPPQRTFLKKFCAKKLLPKGDRL